MKSYPSIPGISESKKYLGMPCTLFYKYDGSSLRYEWSKKRGWYKFGTRRRMFDKSDKEYGRAIDIFHNNFADLDKVFRDKYKTDQAIVFCEFWGEESFAGWHNFEKPFEVTLIDVDIYKKGIVPPQDFIDNFGDFKRAKVVYQGEYNEQLIDDVYQNRFNLKEGVVAKGVEPEKSNHSLWMIKIKTKWWFEELKKRCAESMELKKVLEDNEKEQRRKD